jgi:hypothetical protein
VVFTAIGVMGLVIGYLTLAHAAGWYPFAPKNVASTSASEPSEPPTQSTDEEKEYETGSDEYIIEMLKRVYPIKRPGDQFEFKLGDIDELTNKD